MAVIGSYGPALVATGPTTLVTSPATEYYVIPSITVSNPTAADVSLTVSIGADAAGTRIIGTNATAKVLANTQKTYPGPWRVPASTVVTASSGTNNVITIAFTYSRNPV